jgi:hypothetical protein
MRLSRGAVARGLIASAALLSARCALFVDTGGLAGGAADGAVDGQVDARDDAEVDALADVGSDASDAGDASHVSDAAVDAPDGSVVWSGNGHAYLVVASATGWAQAKLGAEARGGHLVTLTSVGEDAFVFSLVSGVDAYWTPNLGMWLGGFQTAGSVEPEGGWAWVTGEPWNYVGWAGGEPNNNEGNESSLLYGYRSFPAWWDAKDVTPAAGYIVEFE